MTDRLVIFQIILRCPVPLLRFVPVTTGIFLRLLAVPVATKWGRPQALCARFFCLLSILFIVVFTDTGLNIIEPELIRNNQNPGSFLIQPDP